MSVGATSGVGLTQGATAPQQSQGSGSEATDGLNEDAFLQLIIAQMKNQNPLQPVDDTAFLAQLAQFETLNELRSLLASVKQVDADQQRTQAQGLLGRNATLQLADGSTLTGPVTAIKFDQAGPLLMVSGGGHRLSDLVEVTP